MAYPMCILT